MSKCMTLTSGICRGCRDNVGGIKAFYAANIQDVNGITFTNGIVTAIDCDTWYFFEPNKHSSNWSDTENVSIENGTNYYEQSINVLFGKYEQAVRDTLEELASAEMIIIVKDSNNKMWLLGDKDNGMILTAGNSNSGTAYGDFNGVNLTFSRFCKTPAVEVQLDDDYDLKMSMVPCGYPAPVRENIIRYTTTVLPSSQTYLDFVQNDCDDEVVEEKEGVYHVTLYVKPTTAALPGDLFLNGKEILPLITFEFRTYSIVSIPASEFSGCATLTSIILPKELTSINYSTFYGNTALTSIDIPSGVTSIGNEAFTLCNNLTSVTCRAAVPPTLGSDNFGTSGDTLYVPAESIAAYQANSAWSSAFTTITAIQ